MSVLQSARALNKDNQGVAATEMALVTPLLLILLFGTFELGRFFLDEHAVLQAVRDGARYASRQGFSNYACPAGTVSTDVVDRTTSIVRYGKLNATTTDNPRLPYWQAMTGTQPSVQVILSCPTSLDGTEVQGGIYAGQANVPVVTVSAVVSYDSLFGFLGFAGANFNLTAESQLPVMGV